MTSTKDQNVIQTLSASIKYNTLPEPDATLFPHAKEQVNPTPKYNAQHRSVLHSDGRCACKGVSAFGFISWTTAAILAIELTTALYGVCSSSIPLNVGIMITKILALGHHVRKTQRCTSRKNFFRVPNERRRVLCYLIAIYKTFQTQHNHRNSKNS